MWKSVSVCIQGSSHKKMNMPCQDVVKTQCLDNGCIIVLSDGAGSCAFSEYGANITCDLILNYFKQNFSYIFDLDSKIVQEKIIHRIRTRLGLKAKSLDSIKEELSSTLCFVAINDNKFIIGHIGDGIIGAIRKNKEPSLISDSERGEFANTTHFTTSRNYHAHFRLYKGYIEDINSFFIMSDGGADCLFNKKDKTFAKAINIFSAWINHYSIDEVNKALYDNLVDMIPQHTTDDCSFAMCQIIK